MNFVSEDIARYCLSHSDHASPLTEELAAFTEKNVPNSAMLSGPLVGSLVGLLVSLVGAKRIIEVGTYTGYSALSMAERLPADGELITLDCNPETQGIAQRFWDKSPHGKKIKALCGDGSALIAGLKGPFDFAFIDADKVGYLKYLRAILPLMSSRGLVVADNCLWSGKVLHSATEADESTKAIQGFNEAVAQDPALETCLLPIRDGLHLIRKRV